MKMEKVKNWIKKQPFLALGLSLVVVVVAVAALVTGLVSAMYKQERRVVNAPTQITVSAGLADSLEVKEHQAVRSDMGGYTLNTASEVDHNVYTLMPGVDIPKDTFVRVTGKTEIDAYLYIEVKSTFSDPAISFTVDDGNWTALTDNENAPVSGLHSGTVYYYNTGKINMTNFSGTQTIKVLKGNGDEIKVGQDLIHDDTAQTSVLEVYAYMAQALNLDAADAFTTAFSGS